MMKRKGVEIVEDLAKWPEIPKTSSVVQRLKDASERAHQKRRKIWERLKRRV